MRAEPDLRQLRAFVAVVDAGGHTRAAGALGLSQSTVSEAVAALERALGAALFVRGRRGPALTPAGERLLPGARRVLAAMDEAVREVAEGEAEARATVTIGASESIGAYVLPAVLAELRREWPGTRYVVTTAPCPAIRRDVRDGRLDLGLLLTAAPDADDPEDASADLAPGRLVLFARPGHPLAGRRAAAADIAAAPLFLSDAAGDFWGRIRGYVEAAGVPAERLHSAGSVEGVKRAVQADPDALGVLPAYALADELARGALVPVAPAAPLPEVWVRAVWRRDAALPARAAAVAERLRAAAGGTRRAPAAA